MLSRKLPDGRTQFVHANSMCREDVEHLLVSYKEYFNLLSSGNFIEHAGTGLLEIEEKE